jgi:acyl-CoA thioesterase
VTTRFEADTAARPEGDGLFTLTVDGGWHGPRASNGGYVAALLLRAITAAVDDPERRLRSVTFHYPGRLRVGSATAEVTVGHRGRSVTFATGSLMQDGVTATSATAVFTTAVASPEFCDRVFPSVVGPEAASSFTEPVNAPIGRRFDRRWVIGPQPYSMGPEARAGGWVRFSPDDSSGSVPAFDHHVAVALADSWFPALLGRVPEGTWVSTVDFTVHFPSPPVVGYDDWVLASFRSDVAGDGMVIEDGELWTKDGRLLAVSRQMCIIRFTEPA